MASAPANATKYIVILTDGTPTACVGTQTGTAETGRTCEHSGTSNIIADLATDATAVSPTSPDAKYGNAAANTAAAIRDVDSKLKIVTMGYQTDSTNLGFLEERIASGSNYAFLTNTAEVVSALAALVEQIVLEAGENAVASDMIADGFRFVRGISGDVSEEDGKVTCDFGTITGNGVSCTFRIELVDETTCADNIIDGWFSTNAGAELTYDAYYEKVGENEYVKLDSATKQEDLIEASPEYYYREVYAGNDCAGRVVVNKIVEGTEATDEYFDFVVTIDEEFAGTIDLSGLPNGAVDYDGGNVIRFQLANGETARIGLLDNKAGTYSVHVVEEAPSGLNYYCKDMACLDESKNLTIDNVGDVARVTFTANNVYAAPERGKVSVKKVVVDDEENATYNKSWDSTDDVFVFKVSIPAKDDDSCGTYGIQCVPFEREVYVKGGEVETVRIGDTRGLDLESGVSVVEISDLPWYTDAGCNGPFRNVWKCTNIWKYEPIPAIVTIEKVIEGNRAEENLQDFFFAAYIRNADDVVYTGRYRIDEGEWNWVDDDGMTEKFQVEPGTSVVIELDDIRGQVWIITIVEEDPSAGGYWSCVGSCSGEVSVSDDMATVEYTATNIFETPGIILVKKVLRDAEGRIITNDTRDFVFAVEINDYTGGDYKFEGDEDWTEYDGAIAVTLRAGERRAIILRDVIDDYTVVVTEQDATDDNYYCSPASCVWTDEITIEDTRVRVVATNVYAEPEPWKMSVKKIVVDDEGNADYNKSWENDGTKFSFKVTIPEKEGCEEIYGIICGSYTRTFDLEGGESKSLHIRDTRGLDLSNVSVVETSDLSDTWYTDAGCSGSHRNIWKCTNVWKYEPIPAMMTIKKAIEGNGARENLQDFWFAAYIRAAEDAVYTGRYRINGGEWMWTDEDGMTEKFVVVPGAPVVIELDDVRGQVWTITIVEDDPGANGGYWSCKVDGCEGEVSVSDDMTEIEYTAVNVFDKPGCIINCGEGSWLPNTGFGPKQILAFGAEGYAENSLNVVPMAIVGTTAGVAVVARRKKAAKK